jgi:hypothetical protein
MDLGEYFDPEELALDNIIALRLQARKDGNKDLLENTEEPFRRALTNYVGGLYKSAKNRINEEYSM